MGHSTTYEKGASMSLNMHLNETLGKRIKGVIVKEGVDAMTQRLFITFDDNTTLEIYGKELNNSKGLWPGGMEWVRGYLPDNKIVCEYFEEE